KGTPSGGGMIFGKVTQMGTGRPMENAEVAVYSPEGVKLTTTTDSSGNYSISNIQSGSYKVRAYLQGYYLNEVSKELYLEKGKKKVDFQLVVVGGGT
ncbi:carboxypeptidase-like regulatory domain-containing protein, partial [bacterium]|nr:carboxypeptidase-like regulatory domain-containing protein [bacterium]